MKKLLLALLLALAPIPALAQSVNNVTVLDSSGTPRQVDTATTTNTILGEVSGSPTSNTVLARLKTIADALVSTIAVTQSGTWNIATLTTLTGTTTLTPGTGAANLGKAEDAAFSSGDTGVLALGVRNDDFDTLTNTDGDYSPVAVTPSGAVIVTWSNHAAMVRGNATATSTSEFSVVAASGSASLRTYVKSCQVSNTGSTTTLVTFKNGSGGSTLGYTVAAASGGGSNITFEIPIATSLNTALYAQAGSSTTTLYVSCQGYLSP